MINISKFVEVLNELMLEKNLNASDLAKKINVSKVTIGRYKRGERTPSVKNLIALANYFNLTINYLLGLDDKNEKIFFYECLPFNERLAILIEESGSSKYMLEKVTGINSSSIDDWLKNKYLPDVYSLFRLSKYFGCSIDYVLGREK